MKTIKKTLTLLTFGLMIINLTNFSLSAENCPPCTTGCEWQDPYNEPYTYGDQVISSGLQYGGSSCYFNIYFKMRECYCPELRREIYIESIDLNPNGDCDGMTKEQIISKAIQQILYESAVIFDIQNPSSPYEISIKIPSCMKKCSTEIFSTGCDEECCETIYTVQYTGDQGEPRNSVVLIDKETNDPETYCGGASTCSCTNVCASNDVPLGPLFPDYDAACYAGPCSDWVIQPKWASFDIGDCSYVAWFQTRECTYNNVPIMDIKITKIVLATPSCTTNPDNSTILHTAWRKCDKKADQLFQNFEYNDNDKNMIYNRSFSCWSNINNRLLIPCDQTPCCWFGERISILIDENVDTTFFATWVYPYSENNNDDCSESCTNYCSQAKLGDGFNEQLRKIDEFKLKDNVISELKVNIIPQPAVNSLKILAECQERGEVIILLTDLLGNMISSSHINKKSTKIELEFKLDKFLPGLYFYWISINAKEFKSGKFIILK